MARRLALIAVVAAALASADAVAEPPGKAEKKAEKKVEKAPEKKPIDLRLEPRIDLFPKRVLQNRSKTERERRMTLGDDGNWKVQAAQVGAMVGIFGALVGLCGGGKCLVPKQVTNALPDWMRADEPVYSNPRRSQPVRSAR